MAQAGCIVFLDRSVGGNSLLLSYLLSHNLPRGFLPELVQTTCDDRDTFRRVSKHNANSYHLSVKITMQESCLMQYHHVIV